MSITENSFFHQLHRYNFSANATTHDNLIKTLESPDACPVYIGSAPDKVILSRENSMGTSILCENIVVDPFAQDPGNAAIDEDYLNTGITGKKVYAPLFGCGYYLYTGHELRYKVIDSGETLNEDLYKRVMFSAETTLADLYRHNWWYSYNYSTDSFLELPEAGKIANLTRYQLQYRIQSVTGTAEDRLADYGRVLAFLLSKVSLTSEESVLLAPFIETAPTPGDLAVIADKEKRIRDFVKSAHETPLAFARRKGFNA